MILTCQHQMTWSQGASSSLPHCGSKEYSHPHDIYGGKISLGGDGSRGRDIGQSIQVLEDWRNLRVECGI